jgi:hypothetical protein
MKKKSLSLFIALLTVALFVFPLSFASATKETFTLEGTLVQYMWPPGTPHLPPLSPYQTGWFGGEASGKTPAPSMTRIVKWEGVPVVLKGDITAGLEYYDEDEEAWFMDSAGGTMDGNWVLIKYLTTLYLDEPARNLRAQATGFYFIENAYISGFGTGDIKIKAANSGFTIVSGTGDLQGLGGKGTMTDIPGGHGYHYEFEAYFN